MEIGLIGLGRMGMGIASRLLAAGTRVVGFDLEGAARDAAREAGIHAIVFEGVEPLRESLRSASLL